MEEFKRNIKLRLTQNIDQVLTELTEKVDKNSLFFNELIQQKGRLNKIKKDDRIGMVKYETSTIEFNKIRFSIAELISSLSEDDLLDTNRVRVTDELENLFNEAENLKKKEEFEEEKTKVLSGSTGLHFATQEFERLFKFSTKIQEKFKNRTNYFFNSKMNQEQNKFIVYGEDLISINFTWFQYYVDSLQRSKLIVDISNYPTTLEKGTTILYEEEFKRLDSEELVFDFSDGWIKGWKNPKTNKFYKSADLIEEKFKSQLKLILEKKRKK